MLGQTIGLATNLIKEVATQGLAITNTVLQTGTCLAKLTGNTINETINELHLTSNDEFLQSIGYKRVNKPLALNQLFNQQQPKQPQETNTMTVNTDKTNKPNPQEYILLSGGALGADTMFGEASKLAGIPEDKILHFYAGEISQYNAPNGNTKISDKDYEEGRYMSAKAANYMYGYQHQTMKDIRLIRNWSQIKYTQGVFAVSYINQKGNKAFPHLENDTRLLQHDCVTGGTGYAVSMAILLNKPVYVFDMNTNQWCEYNYQTKQWFVCDTPVLTKVFTGIGSRQLTKEGIQAIIDLFRNTFE